MADNRHFEKPLNRHISARFFLKIQDGGSRHLKNHKNRDISSTV